MKERGAEKKELESKCFTRFLSLFSTYWGWIEVWLWLLGRTNYNAVNRDNGTDGISSLFLHSLWKWPQFSPAFQTQIIVTQGWRNPQDSWDISVPTIFVKNFAILAMYVCMYIFLILGFLLTKWVTEIFFFLSNSLSQINGFRFRRPCILSIYYLMYVSVRLILDTTTYLYNEETLKESLALGAIYW